MKKENIIRNSVALSNVCGAVIKVAAKVIIFAVGIGLSSCIVADTCERKIKREKIQKQNKNV